MKTVWYFQIVAFLTLFERRKDKKIQGLEKVLYWFDRSLKFYTLVSRIQVGEPEVQKKNKIHV